MSTISWKHYDIYKEPIGKGSFSKVYKALDTKTQEYVAIKKINFLEFSDTLKKRIHTELFILQSTSHRNIVKFIDFEFVNNYIFMIFEYCNEGNISKYIGKNLEENKLNNIFKEIINGLSYLHSKNIIHRDLKPENILLHNGIPKICDFGLSTIIKEEIAMTATICGTPLYMSPEHLLNKPYTISTDIWSLGILFYTIAYGIHPFGSPVSITDYKKLIYNDITYSIRYSETFTDLLKGMLEVESDKRLTIKEVKNHVWFYDNDFIFEMENLELEDVTDKKSEISDEIREDFKRDIENKYSSSCPGDWKWYKGSYTENYFENSQAKTKPIIIVKKTQHSGSGNSFGELLYNSLEFIKKKLSDYSL